MSFFQKLIWTLQRKSNEAANIFVDVNAKRDAFLTQNFLSSSAYDDLMMQGEKNKSDFKLDLNDAEEHSKNYRFRHYRNQKVLGGWRWKGLWLEKETILPILYKPESKGIDFGGANGPVTKEVTVVDFAKKDIFDRKVKYKDLKALDFNPDFIFSSHTLEHIDNLDEIFIQMKEKLAPEGMLILNLPAYTCLRWRSGIHKNRAFNDHKWTFLLKGTKIPEGVQNPLFIDEKVSKYFRIEKADYTGDNSIFILALN